MCVLCVMYFILGTEVFRSHNYVVLNVVLFLFFRLGARYSGNVYRVSIIQNNTNFKTMILIWKYVKSFNNYISIKKLIVIIFSRNYFLIMKMIKFEIAAVSIWCVLIPLELLCLQQGKENPCDSTSFSIWKTGTSTSDTT